MRFSFGVNRGGLPTFELRVNSVRDFFSYNGIALRHKCKTKCVFVRIDLGELREGLWNSNGVLFARIFDDVCFFFEPFRVFSVADDLPEFITRFLVDFGHFNTTTYVFNIKIYCFSDVIIPLIHKTIKLTDFVRF